MAYVPKHGKPPSDKPIADSTVKAAGEAEQAADQTVAQTVETAAKVEQIADSAAKIVDKVGQTAAQTGEAASKARQTTDQTTDQTATQAVVQTAAQAADQTSAFPTEDIVLAIVEANIAVNKNSEPAFPPVEPTQLPDPQNDPALIKIRRRRWPIAIAIILVIIIISGSITFYVLYNQAMDREARRAQGYVLLDQSIAMIQESDPVVIAIDSAVNSEVTEADLLQRQVLIDKIPATLTTLDEAVDAANQSLELLTSADDKALAMHVLDAANNRKDMLSSGQVLVQTDIQAMNCALVFGQAWDLIVTADTDMRNAAALSGSGIYDDALQAVEANKAVIEKLDKAVELMKEAGSKFKDVDFSSVDDYLALKKESVLIAQESDQALVDADLETAQTKNQEFRDKDNAVVAAAAKIPAEPLRIITSTYDKLTAEARQAYDSARANAADADVFIREYVGVETQTAVQ